MNIRYFRYIFASILTISALSVSYSQRDPTPNSPRPQHIFETQLFIADPVIFYNKDSASSRLDLYIRIPYNSLQFAKDAGSSNNYSANIQYSVILKNFSDSVFVNEVKDLTITEKYDSKVLKRSALTLVKNYYLNPGKFILNITVTDYGTQKKYSSQYSFEVIDNSARDIFSSDILLLRSYSKNSDGKATITPMISNDVGRTKDFFIFYELYNNSSDIIVRDINYSFKSNNDNILSSRKQSYTLQPGTNTVTEKFSSLQFEDENFVLEISDSSGKLLTRKYLINRPLFKEPETRIWPPQF
ncbi:hypothetical protein BH10BAC5_BH10BAC5_08790 [soil metagenome]